MGAVGPIEMAVAISGSGPKGGTHADGNNYGSPPMFLACRTTERQAERRVLKTRSECEHGSEAIRASGPSRAVPERRGPGCPGKWRPLPGFPWYEPALDPYFEFEKVYFSVHVVASRIACVICLVGRDPGLLCLLLKFGPHSLDKPKAVQHLHIRQARDQRQIFRHPPGLDGP